MSSLTTLNLTYNQLTDVVNISDFDNCSIPWKIVDLSYNYLTTFPSTLFTINRFDSVYLNNNQLTSIDLSVVALVQNSVDLRNNKITSIMNPMNFNITLDLPTGETLILLDNNPVIEFNDGIYEMYGSCKEVQQGFSGTLNRSSLTFALGNIDFGTTQVICNCNQYYILQMLQIAFGNPVLGRISTLACANQTINFVNYTCSLGYSTVNFTQVQPRLCQLDFSSITTLTTILTTSTSTSMTETTSTTLTTTLTTTSVSSTTTTSTETSTSTTTTSSSSSSTISTTTSITTATTSTFSSTSTTPTDTSSSTTMTTTSSSSSSSTVSTTTSVTTTMTSTTISITTSTFSSTSTTSTDTSSSTTTTTSSSSSTVSTTTSVTTTSTVSSTSSTTTFTETTSSTSSTSATTKTTTTSSTSSITSTDTTSSTTTLTTSISVQNGSTCLATFSISYTNLLLTCPSNIDLTLLPINNYAITILERITTLRIEGFNTAARGPLQTIPSNICFLTNLQVLNISFNRLDHLDSLYLSANPYCLNNLRTLDMSNNYFTNLPSIYLTKIPKLRQLFLRNNQLTSFDFSLLVLISTLIDLSNNQISKITNNANVNLSTYTLSLPPSIDLTNNSQFIDLTDSIYEMYGACYDIYQIFNTSISPIPSLLTIGFLNINFGTSKINCTCDQFYIQKKFLSTFNDSQSMTSPLYQTLCTDGTLFYNNRKSLDCSDSSVNFINTRPRLCKIKSDDGSIVFVNTTENNTGIFPYYLTQTINNSYCLFTFYTGGLRVSIDCVNGSQVLTEISLTILNNIYFQNITQVIINNQSSLSQIPSYLCSLPSTSIDLSNQSFIILDKNTFPCLSNTTLQTINLSYNQIYIVNLTLANWISIDLTSNNLTQLPYSLLNTMTNRQLIQRNLRLQANKLTQFDLFIYTYPNTFINLENNQFSKTINGYHMINNYQKQSLRIGPMNTIVSFANQMRFLLNDLIAQNYNTCDSQSLIYLIEVFQYMKINNNNITVEIQCDCSSIYIKEYFSLLNSSEKLTNRFSCSNLSSLTVTQFQSLTETNCLSNIVLSSNRLCQFARIQTQDSSVTNKPVSNSTGQSLAVILGSILGSLGFLVILACLIAGIYYKRKTDVTMPRISTFARTPYFIKDPVESSPPATASRDISSYYLTSDDLSPAETTLVEKRKRRRKLREPPVDYETDSPIFRLKNPPAISSEV